MITQIKKDKNTALSDLPILTLLFVSILWIGIYYIVRYQGFVGETDTSTFTRLTRAMIESGKLIPQNIIYSNGYGFQSLIIFFVNLSNISLSSIQVVGASLLMGFLILPAWLLYREFTRSGKVASLACVFLFIQPEFLFPILRGTHEKWTRGLMLLGLYLLLRGLRTRRVLNRFLSSVVAFYLIVFALITFNNLMSMSFIVAIALALGLSWVGLRFPKLAINVQKSTLDRLLIVILTLIIVSFLFTFYAYPPAQAQLKLMQSVQDRVASLVLQFEQTATNPYMVINTGWISNWVYILVSLANWLSLGISALIWLVMTIDYIRKSRTPAENEIFLWAFYGAFAFQGLISIIVDVSGAIASNLQHRAFPSFVMVAAPLIAKWLSEWKPAKKTIFARLRKRVWLIIPLLAILSVLKATNEPLLSNNWIFYHPSELIATEWFNQNSQSSTLWLDYTGRISSACEVNGTTIDKNNHIDSFIPDLSVSNYLISDIERSHSLRLHVQLPISFDSLQIYDNGITNIYHIRPSTPYER